MPTRYYIDIDMPDTIEVRTVDNLENHPLNVRKAQEVIDIYRKDAVVIGHLLLGNVLVLVIPDDLRTNMVRVNAFFQARQYDETCVRMHMQGNIRVLYVNLAKLKA